MAFNRTALHVWKKKGPQFDFSQIFVKFKIKRGQVKEHAASTGHVILY
jgi:hypothetical protein